MLTVLAASPDRDPVLVVDVVDNFFQAAPTPKPAAPTANTPHHHAAAFVLMAAPSKARVEVVTTQEEER